MVGGDAVALTVPEPLRQSGVGSDLLPSDFSATTQSWWCLRACPLRAAGMRVLYLEM